MKKFSISLILLITLSIAPVFASVQFEAGGGYSYMGVCDNFYTNAAFFFIGDNPRIAIEEREKREAKFNGLFSQNSEKLYRYYTNSASNTINNFGVQLHLGFSLFTLPLGAMGESGERLMLGFGIIDRIYFDKDNAISLTLDFFNRGNADAVLQIGAAYTRTILEKHIVSAGLVFGIDEAINSQKSGVNAAMPGFGFNLCYGFKLL